MPDARIGVISVHPAAMQVAADTFARLWPEADLCHVLDERLFRWLDAAGAVQPGMAEVLDRHARRLVDSGAHAVLFTCSAFYSCIDPIAARAEVPVIGPNQAMIESALAAGTRLALLATVPATLTALAEEVHRRAAGRTDPTLLPRLVAGAFERLAAGDAAAHDELILQAARGLPVVDAILLGQFTMARAAGALQARVEIPVLAAPSAAVAALQAMWRSQRSLEGGPVR